MHESLISNLLNAADVEHGGTRKCVSLGNGISESEQQTACIDMTVFKGLSRIMVLYFDYPVLHKK